MLRKPFQPCVFQLLSLPGNRILTVNRVNVDHRRIAAYSKRTPALSPPHPTPSPPASPPISLPSSTSPPPLSPSRTRSPSPSPSPSLWKQLAARGSSRWCHHGRKSECSPRRSIDMNRTHRLRTFFAYAGWRLRFPRRLPVPRFATSRSFLSPPMLWSNFSLGFGYLIDIPGESFGQETVGSFDPTGIREEERLGEARPAHDPVRVADSGHTRRETNERASERVSERWTRERACVTCVLAGCVRAREQKIRLVIASLALRRPLSLWRLCVSPSASRSFPTKSTDSVRARRLASRRVLGRQRRCQRWWVIGYDRCARDDGPRERRILPMAVERIISYVWTRDVKLVFDATRRLLPRKDNARRRTMGQLPSRRARVMTARSLYFENLETIGDRTAPLRKDRTLSTAS